MNRRPESTTHSVARLVAMLETRRKLKANPKTKLIEVIHAEDAIRQVRLTARLRILMFAYKNLGGAQ